jgi:hypothetical protein
MARKKKSSRKARKAKTLTEAKNTETKKSLLNETTIRRFQKLANLGALSEEPAVIQEQEMAEELPEEEGLEGLEGEEGLEGLEDEELGMEEEPAVDEGTVEDLVSAIADAITDTTGIPVNVEGGEEDLEGLEGEEDLEGLEGEEGLEGLEGLEGEEELPPEEEMMQEAVNPTQLRNYLISEVSNRVRARVQNQQQALYEHQMQQQALYEHQMQQQALYEHQVRQQTAAHEAGKQQIAESLAARIFTRLKGKKRRK